MRICFISQEYPPETEGGGIGTYTHMVARGLADLGHDVHVIAQTYSEPRVDADGPVPVHRVPARLNIPLINRVLYPIIPSVLNCHAWSRSARRAYDALAAERPFDIVETSEFMAQGLAFGDIHPTRLVTKLHTPLYLVHELNQTPSNLDRNWAKELERRATRASAVVTSCSADLGRRVGERWGLRSVVTLHNPISLESFSPNGAPSGPPTAVFAGKLSLRKGTDTFALAIPRVLDRIPGARFLFAGRDTESAPEGRSMRGWIESTLDARSLSQTEFLGYVPHTEMRSVYGCATVVAVPSRYENFPYVCLEPMAMAVGIAGTRVGGIPEIVEDGVSGRLVPPEDPGALADALVEALGDPARAAAWGAASRRIVEQRFAAPVIARATLAVYEQALAGKARP